MTRDQLEHALRAVQTVTGESEFVIIGSQAILGQFPEAPDELLVSQEIDIYAPAKPESSDLIQGACGEGTGFPRTHDFYIDGVSPTTAVVPGGWRNRTIPVCNANTNGATGWCLEVHDIAVAKYFANRQKDRRYLTDLWRYDMLDQNTLDERFRNAPVTKAKRRAMTASARADQARAARNPASPEARRQATLQAITAATRAPGRDESTADLRLRATAHAETALKNEPRPQRTDAGRRRDQDTHDV